MFDIIQSTQTHKSPRETIQTLHSISIGRLIPFEAILVTYGSDPEYGNKIPLPRARKSKLFKEYIYIKNIYLKAYKHIETSKKTVLNGVHCRLQIQGICLLPLT